MPISKWIEGNRRWYFILVIAILVSSCADLEQKVFVRRVDFEVDSKANKGNPFVCNIVVPYSPDLVQKLHGMDAQTYFTQLPELKRLYKDKIEIFSYDIIPGKSKIKQEINPRSRQKAFGAYIFAKYTVNGKFAERLGRNRKIIVKFEEYKMIIYDGTLKLPDFDDTCAGKKPKQKLPKTDTKALPKPKKEKECIECPDNAEYAIVCDNGSIEYYPKNKKDGKINECVECPEGAEYAEQCNNEIVKYYNSDNEECVECSNNSDYMQQCDDGTISYFNYKDATDTGSKSPNIPDNKNLKKKSASVTKKTNKKSNVPLNKKHQSK